jgi:hypothetical protein
VIRAWTRLLGLVVTAAGLFAWPSFACGHEVRPAFLQITELSDGRYDILWKQPSQGTMAVRLIPHVSGGLLEGSPSAIETAANFQIQIWHDVDAGTAGLDGRTLEIEGLRQTITDVLVSITPTNAEAIQWSLRPQSPSLVLHLRQNGLAVPAYLTLGVEHILTGTDHLCFVLGLLLLVRNRIMLLKTITAFTLAHSITLAATALHLISVRPALIEALVALSILFVAVELVHFYRGREGLTVRLPWLIAFTFGLLHGSAFAGALAQIGLPPNAVPLSLLLFNVGVELGQILFLAVMLGIGVVLARLPRALPAWTRWVPPYAIGIFAAVWFLERVHAAIARG